MECFESPDFFDQYTRALGEADGRFISIVDSLGMMLGNITYLATLAGLIIEFDAVLLAVVAVCVAGILAIRSARADISYQFDKEHTSTSRKMQYIRKLFYELGYAKEIRVFDIKKLVFSRYSALAGEKRSAMPDRGNSISF